MGKKLFIAEKPSVANEFAKALKQNMRKKDGYLESDDYVVTWCVGHLVTMSYPEVYDERLKRWSIDTLPFIPETFLYEVIPAVQKQFDIVSGLLNREDVECIYVCTDSGREGEYIYRLVEQQSGVKGKARKRVWIDSQTEEEINRGIAEAKDLSEYDNLSEAAYLRAKEDYLMGINFSRILTLKYGRGIASYLKQDRAVVSVGRVMTCVLGMIVRREREIREFVKTPFYRVLAGMNLEDFKFDAEWRVNEKSKYFNHPALYKENGFKERERAEELISEIKALGNDYLTVSAAEKKKETKNPPLLYNLAELQNECSKMFKISPDQTLSIVQELYEKKLVTYPRTDARVLSTAVAKEIHKNIGGLAKHERFRGFAEEILNGGQYKNIAKTRYVNDKQITDHYAIIPTGQGLASLNALNPLANKVYEVIVRRFLCVFFPAATYQKVSLVLNTDFPAEGENVREELFHASFKVLVDEGYLKVLNAYNKDKASENNGNKTEEAGQDDSAKNGESQEEADVKLDENVIEMLKKLKKGDKISLTDFVVKEGETSPPKRYNSGSIILAMENAGQLIEDEELRAQIKGSGIGTSATRAEILKKLININYISLNKKTQILTPSLFGEIIFDVVNASIKSLLNPELTASWEKGLTYVAEGTITSEEYMMKLDDFVSKRVNGVKNLNNQSMLRYNFDRAAAFYKK
ncbi:MAG: type IA DNA topoisomerase [Lachnospiraceae bacterium]|nr:type IA DNA topoisomerase [Lachnospiraceae bacterium]